MERFGNFIIANPKLVIAGIIVLALLAIYPAINIRTDFNLEGFYPQDDPALQDYHLLESEFGRDDNAILIGFKTDSLFSEPVLSDLRELSSLFNDIEDVQDVFSLWSARQTTSINGTLRFSPYIEEDSLGVLNLEQLKRKMVADPLLENYLLNEKGNTTAIVILINEKNNNYETRSSVITRVEEILSSQYGDYTFHISGIPYFRNQYVNMLNDEIVVYIAISSVLIMLLLGYMYRTVWGVLFPMVIVWTTLLLTVAILQLTGGYLEVMSTTIAPILLCVGIADAIHMISKYNDSREEGLEKKSSILEMLKMLGSATFLTSITTAIGFASLISSSVVPMKRFGIYTGVGVMIAYMITITFLPALLKITRKKRVVNERTGSFYPFIHRFLGKVSNFNRANYLKIIAVSLLISILFTVGIRNLDVNGRVFDDIRQDTKLMQDSRFFSDNIAPQFPLEFVIETGSTDSAVTAKMMKKAIEFEEFLLSYPEIHRVSGLHTLIRQVHEVLNPGSEGHLPESDNAVAQYLLLLEINGTDEILRFINFDYSKLRISAFSEDAGSKRINEIRDEINPKISSLFPNQNVITTGTVILNADLTDKIVYSLAWSILLALFVITAIMVFMFRNLRLIIIALLPNLLPLLVVGGMMGFLGLDIKSSTAVIFTIALGIAVDDSIHYLARFRIEYRRRNSLIPSLAATTIRTGRAIIITSLILVAGFGTLTTSAFTSTTLMGALVCITIVTALFSDLLLLPALFLWLKPKLSFTASSRESK